MKPLPVVSNLALALALALALVGCTEESACERYERIGAAADADNQSASPEEVREAAEAQAECFAEQGDRE
jgi:hypothetical protein